MVGEDEGVGDDNIFPSASSKDDGLGNVVRSKRLTAAVRDIALAESMVQDSCEDQACVETYAYTASALALSPLNLTRENS